MKAPLLSWERTPFAFVNFILFISFGTTNSFIPIFKSNYKNVFQ